MSILLVDLMRKVGVSSGSILLTTNGNKLVLLKHRDQNSVVQLYKKIFIYWVEKKVDRGYQILKSGITVTGKQVSL
jgi:hypothetical protein